MAEEGDEESKTEDPSGKRLDEAREKGQTPTSREVGTALLLLASIGLFSFQGDTLWLSLQSKMRFLLSGPITSDFNLATVSILVRDLLTSMLLDLLPFFLVFVLVGIMASLVQHGWFVTFEPLMPKFSRISPMQGFKRMFSIRSVLELIKSLAKMGVVAIAVYLGLQEVTYAVLNLAGTSLTDVVNLLASSSMGILWRVTMAFLVLAILDFSYTKFEFLKSLRMTKQEVKDELKQTDGDPAIKGRIRQVQREMARRRMMQEVPKATVVITNPTHFSIALRYTPGENSAPVLVAKGRGEIALRIRELAREHQVPLVENPPLARTLYQDVEVNATIPPELFKAVAEILAYVFRLKGNK